jgi:hypothetical protein
MMAPVTLGDICAAARVLLTVPEQDWPQTLHALLSEAADRRTLMAVCLRRAPPPAPPTDDPAHLRALLAVLAALVARNPPFLGQFPRV